MTNLVFLKRYVFNSSWVLAATYAINNNARQLKSKCKWKEESSANKPFGLPSHAATIFLITVELRARARDN